MNGRAIDAASSSRTAPVAVSCSIQQSLDFVTSTASTCSSTPGRYSSRTSELQRYAPRTRSAFRSTSPWTGSVWSLRWTTRQRSSTSRTTVHGPWHRSESDSRFLVVAAESGTSSSADRIRRNVEAGLVGWTVLNALSPVDNDRLQSPGDGEYVRCSSISSGCSPTSGNRSPTATGATPGGVRSAAMCRCGEERGGEGRCGEERCGEERCGEERCGE